MYDFLRKVPLFAGLADADFARLCQVVEEVHLSAGSELFAEGTIGMRAYVIEDGELEVVKRSGGREVLLAVRRHGEVIGETALLEQAPRQATVRARQASRLLAIHQNELEKLLRTSPSAARAMLHTMLDRWRNTEALLRQSEKLAQLGTLSAGMAHELNNPVSALQRGIAHLQELMHTVARLELDPALLNVTAGSREDLLRLVAVGGTGTTDEVSGLQRVEQEEVLERWLRQQGVTKAWEYAPALLDEGFDSGRLQALLEPFPQSSIRAILVWLALHCAARRRLVEMAQGAARIAEIVNALRSYTFLDQAPLQAVDIHSALDSTLQVLRPRLEGVTIRRNYARDLPTIQAYGSELNQVFTHLIENAADALTDARSDPLVEIAQIMVRTAAEDEGVLIEIEDNGPGIPEAIMSRIFDPFFTTKPPGQGTGLGLYICYNTIINKHHGELAIRSEPGKTCVRIWLPIHFAVVEHPVINRGVVD